MGTDKTPQIEHGQLVIVGSKGSGKSSLYQCLKSPNPQVADGLNCSVLVEDWQPFSTESPVADECREYFKENLSEEDLDASVKVWDICGHEPLWTIQQLCMPETALFVLVFNVRNPRDAKLVPQWVQMIQAKCLGAEIIIVASNCEVSEDPCQNVLDEIQKMENEVVNEIKEELLSLGQLDSNIWVKNRIEQLERILEKRPNVCSTVYLTSAVTGKGLAELRYAILKRIFDVEKSKNGRNFNEQEMNLMKKLRPLHDGKGIVMSGKDFKAMATTNGFHEDNELESIMQNMVKQGLLSRVKIPSTFEDKDDIIIITDPCCFANASAMIHRDENPQDFVNKLQKSSLVQRFWPTSTRPNDWTLRSAIDDIVNKGMIRESFFPLCWQVWNINEEDIKQLLPVMLKLGVLVDGAPKAGYEIELALSYFKNLSVTKRYHLPLLTKLPTDPPRHMWPNKAPTSTVTVDWHYHFQQGYYADLILCILAISKNFKPSSIIIAHWQTGLIVRVGDVDILMVSKPQEYHLTARCIVTNGNKQAVNMAWSALAQFVHITECFLSNFHGLYYRFGSSSIINSSSRSIHNLISDTVKSSKKSDENLWLIPPIDLQKNDEEHVPLDLLTWMKNLADLSCIYISYEETNKEEAKVLGTNLERSGFNTHLESLKNASSVTDYAIQRCSAVIMLLTKLYLEEVNLKESIEVFESLGKVVIGAYFEEDLNCSLTNTTNLNSGSGNGSAHIFNPDQLHSLITDCRRLIFGTGYLAPLSGDSGDTVSETNGVFDLEDTTESITNLPPKSAVTYAPAMETGKRTPDETKKKHHVKFEGDEVSDHMTDHVTIEDNQIKPLAACTVAAAMVGAAAEHLSQNRKASSAGIRAANATAKVARAVAHGDTDAATDALSDVVKIVDGLSNKKQKGDGFNSSQKSKTCVIF